MTTTTQHCGDSCGLIDFTMAVAGDRLLPEERMKLAIEAVTSEKMSQRAAAAKFDLNRDTLQRRIKQVAEIGHPTKTQSSTGVSASAKSEKSAAGTIRGFTRELLFCQSNPLVIT